jgi:hypothetical protein
VRGVTERGAGQELDQGGPQVGLRDTGPGAA